MIKGAQRSGHLQFHPVHRQRQAWTVADQSPKVNKPGHFADLVAALPDAGTSAAAKAIADANACSTGPCGFVQDDDVALIWLKDQSKTQQVADYLNANAKALFIDEVLAGDELEIKFNDPKHDSRTPDIIVQPQYGTIYTTSTARTPNTAA